MFATTYGNNTSNDLTVRKIVFWHITTIINAIIIVAYLTYLQHINILDKKHNNEKGILMDENGFSKRLAYKIILKILRPIATNGTNIFNTAKNSIRRNLHVISLQCYKDIFYFKWQFSFSST